MIVAVEQICKEYSAQPVLENIDLQVKRGQKIGLVGANGSGKTTLLRIVAGELEADSGRVMLAKGCKIGYQSQKLVFAPGSTVLEEGLSVFANLAAMEQQLRQLEEQLSEGDELVLNQYAQLSHEFEELGGYSYPARTRGILRGLGFSEAEFAQLVDSLSGGQQSRLALAKLLLSDPDLLLLDEPTNHLDIAAINWLEGYLKGFRGGLLMVSHDRRFLENLADTIGELENTRLVVYPGNYRFFLKERKLRREKLLKNYLAQQEYIKRTEDFIARNIEGQNTKQAQSRRRDLEKLVRLETPPAQIPRASFKFDQRRPSGRHVLQCHNLAKSFAGKNIFHNASFQLERGDRTGLIGPNGCGKTTLLELICGLQQPDRGSVSFGHYVELAYYSQMRGDLEGKNSAAEEIWSVRPAWTRGEVQNFLARFLFRGEDAFKLVKFMSGGEASRLALAKLLLSRANFLILDEPTNHLDLDSREVLEDALNQFPGTILIVSHDRWFLNAVTNITLEMNSEGIERFQGSYDYWLAKKEARELEAIPPVPPVKPESKETVAAKLSPNEIYRRQQRLAQLEAEVAKAEDRQTQLSLELTDPQVGHEKLHQLSIELQQVQNLLAQHYREWESLADELEENQ
ncbi:MAG TPA: ABC transporter ATP-binding protein [Firmicutes bacterium]|jgi:ATP-binding cassette subfamily F protein 3|nr:ABC transporter ATP-binding protein [Bacillota bacterium]